MILRLTKKVTKKIKLEDFDINPKESMTVLPLSEWYINHFVLDRRGYFIITESKSLFSLLEQSAKISNVKIFRKWITILFRNFEKENNLKTNSIDTTILQLCKTSNRSVVGSQNDLVKMAKAMYYYDDEDYIDSSKINRTPMSYTNSFPDKDIKVEIKRRRDF